MKKTLLTAVAALLISISFTQTAVNFNCNDCNGMNHDLFSELDAGKVIVLCWVMPCGSCVGPSLTTYNVVQSFQSANPDKVFMYLVDDYANTNCGSLGSWANNQGMTNLTLFSNNAIKMSDYGSSGMPKVVVVGDVNHAVFYNANNSVNATALQGAINTAIMSTTTGVDEGIAVFSSVGFFPNPSNTASSLVFSLEQSTDVKIEIHNQTGQKISEDFYTLLPVGVNKIEVTTAGMSNGIYYVKLSSGVLSQTIKIAILH